MNSILDTVKVKDIDPVLQLQGRLESEEQLDALELTLLCKRAEKFLEGLRQRLLPEANKTFSMLKSTDPTKAKWELANGLGFVYQYAPRAEWSFPLEIREAEADLKKAKAEAKKDETAIKTIPAINPLTNSTFAITLAEKF